MKIMKNTTDKRNLKFKKTIIIFSVISLFTVVFGSALLGVGISEPRVEVQINYAAGTDGTPPLTINALTNDSMSIMDAGGKSIFDLVKDDVSQFEALTFVSTSIGSYIPSNPDGVSGVSADVANVQAAWLMATNLWPLPFASYSVQPSSSDTNPSFTINGRSMFGNNNPLATVVFVGDVIKDTASDIKIQAEVAIVGFVFFILFLFSFLILLFFVITGKSKSYSRYASKRSIKTSIKNDIKDLEAEKEKAKLQKKLDNLRNKK